MRYISKASAKVITFFVIRASFRKKFYLNIEKSCFESVYELRNTGKTFKNS